MSEIQDVTPTTPTPRDIKDINNEYAQVCAFVGERQFRIQAMTNEIQGMMQKLSGLTIEAAEVQKAEKAKEEPKKEELN